MGEFLKTILNCKACVAIYRNLLSVFLFKRWAMLSYMKYSQISHFSRSEILLKIDEELQPKGFHSDKRNTEEKIENALKWIDNRLSVIRAAICENQNIQKLAENVDTNKSKLFAALADAIGMLSLGISPFLLAAFLISSGVQEICSDE